MSEFTASDGRAQNKKGKRAAAVAVGILCLAAVGCGSTKAASGNTAPYVTPTTARAATHSQAALECSFAPLLTNAKGFAVEIVIPTGTQPDVSVNFGDGSASESKDPYFQGDNFAHSYHRAGVYSVSATMRIAGQQPISCGHMGVQFSPGTASPYGYAI